MRRKGLDLVGVLRCGRNTEKLRRVGLEKGLFGLGLNRFDHAGWSFVSSRVRVLQTP